MNIKVISILPVFLCWGCKESPVTERQKEEPVTEQKAILPLPPVMAELATFANSVPSDTSDITQFIEFKQIDTNQEVSTITMKEAAELYGKMMKGNHVVTFPIFEMKNTDNVILAVQDVGFGGPIWAKVLVDKKSLVIKKIEFDHKAESDGYGAAMAQSSFEDKFVGTPIVLNKNTFTLQMNMEKRVDDGTMVDGISGATMTSQAALDMVNLGLQHYKGYLRP